MDVTIPCPCPPKADGTPRHETDRVTFRDRLDFSAGLVIRKALTMVRSEDPDAGSAEYLASMTEHYLLYGIASWTLVDAKGKAIEVSKPAIRAFLADHEDIAFDLVEPADDLYSEQVLLPLLRKASTSSPPLPTEPSISVPNGSVAKPRKPSRRSSTSITPTGSTATITSLHAGGSSTSRKLA